MESFPTFHDPTKFPAFAAVPIASQDADGAANTTIVDEDSNTLDSSYYLVGTISENMTLGTNPTFVCKDRNVVPFAVTIKLGSNSPGEKFDAKTCKKGYTMAIHEAKKYGSREGKQGFIETTPGKIKIIPAGLETLIEMSSLKQSNLSNSGVKEGLNRCQACSKEGSGDELSRCKGCEVVWYCNKTCQTVGWNEKGHKTYCKILRAVKDLAGE